MLEKHVLAATLARHRLSQLSPGALRTFIVYDLRHSAISLMMDAGGDLKAVSAVVGHSNQRIAMRVYRHVKQEQRTAAMHGLAATLDSPPPGDPAGLDS